MSNVSRFVPILACRDAGCVGHAVPDRHSRHRVLPDRRAAVVFG